ncbi:MAG: hypothetical protein QF903_02000 [Planctomycetota bacterium]|jgi:DNA-directed RNA polymerase specialized sigma24 family protein|nr:hypothetical protein [Planctomycetota bacterium]MDP6764137.1 hypothetical protein [Planctomycetota bacterium]MDP6988237.1 hypothetical protein [Planctomycetota bacterium]
MSSTHTERARQAGDGPEGAGGPAGRDERTEEVLGHWRRGDLEARRRLFFKLRRFLIGRVRTSVSWPALRARETPEDVAHDLLVSLFQRERFATFEDRGEGSLRAWLDCCLQQYMVDMVRRQSTRRAGEGRAPLPLDGGGSDHRAIDPAASDPGASTLLFYEDWKARILAALPAREELVWRLRVDEELDYNTISEREDITPEGARGLFFRARRRLRDLGLGEDDLEGGEHSDPEARGTQPG